jgi:hypothetical protein
VVLPESCDFQLTREPKSSGSGASSILEQGKSTKQAFKDSETSSAGDVKDAGATVEQTMHNDHYDVVVSKKAHYRELISYLLAKDHLQVLVLRLDGS